jgi:neutral ceramidase
MIKFKALKIDITPNRPSRLTGMKENEFSKGIHNNLEINAMVFKSEQKNIFFISIDTLFISAPIKQFITDEINKHFGLTDESDILIMSTHTHYAPSIEENRIDLGVKDIQYFDFMKTKIIELIHSLTEITFVDVDISLQNANSEGLTNNRRRKVRLITNYFKQIIAMEPNLSGFKRERIDIIKIINKQNNKLIGLIWTFPCHPTNLYDKSLVSSEFIGEIRNAVRKKINSNDLGVVYMQGFSGNIRATPPKRFSIEKFVRDLLQLSYPVKYYRFQNQSEYSSWIDSLTHKFMGIWETSDKMEIGDVVVKTQVIKKEILEILGIEVKGTGPIIFRKVNFGSKLAFVTISAEVVAEYTKILGCLFTEDVCIFVGCVDEVFGYLPTLNQIEEGGYESNDYFNAFLVSGKFSLQIENNIKECIRKMN